MKPKNSKCGKACYFGPKLAGSSLVVAAAFTLVGAATAQADYVTIGDQGNDPDGTGGYDAVGYTYKISATEVTIEEFEASNVGDGNEDYWNDGTRTVGADAPAS